MEAAHLISSSSSVEDYFRSEQNSHEKHEFRNGQIFAMAGGTPSHSLIILNAGGELRQRLKGSPCRAYDSNLRVRLSPSVRYSYPDATVICGDPEFDPLDKYLTTVTNPRLILEVTSKGSESFDRVEKFRHYLQLETLQEYVLVSQQRPRIESYFRQPGGVWLFDAAEGIDAAAKLRSLSIELPLNEVYAGVKFPPETAEEAGIL